MMMSSMQRPCAILLLFLISFVSQAQPVNIPGPSTEKKEVRPYKILTAGKQVTIKSNKAINHVMLWTTGGNRVIEQKQIKSYSYTFIIPVNQKNFFLMIGLEGGKIYTEKIGIRE